MPPNNNPTDSSAVPTTTTNNVATDSAAPPAKRPRTSNDTSLARLDGVSDARHFFSTHVATRQPCIVSTTAALVNDALKPWPKSVDALKTILGDCRVQVEQRPDVQQTFGQGRTTKYLTSMSFADFVQKSKAQPDVFYLSTQVADKDNDDQYAQYSCLTQRLVDQGYIAPHLEHLAGNLQLSSCHLWMGTTQGSCSGLHHDFHDNFYCVKSGRKRLLLYPPTAAEKYIPVYGTIDQIHPNGLVSYAARPTRADGVPLALLETKSLETASNKNQEENEEEEDDDEEDEVVIGKGFDYKSDDAEEDNEIDYTRDDFEELEDGEEVNDDNDVDESSRDEEDDQKPAADKPPDHFSPVNLDSSTLYEDYPAMRECEPIFVELKAGDILYLPASWFHCVWSYKDDDDFHVAVNYWYQVPDQLDSFVKPYNDDFWAKQSAKS